MADITGSITKIRTSDNSEHYINAKYWDGHEWGELASALKYCGITTTKLTDGATTNPVVIGGENHTATAGCVVFYEDTEGDKSTTKEFVFNGSKWELLGADSTYKVIQSAVSSPNADGSATAFIDSIEQDANGVITVSKKNVDFSNVVKPNDLKTINGKSILGEGNIELEPKKYPSNDEIWYTSTDGNIVTPVESDVFGANVVSNTYENGKGIIKFDGSVTSIGEWAFYGCSSLTSVTIGNSVTWIGKYAFRICTSLTSITIPDSVTSIGRYAFEDCSNLTSVTIGNSVTTIGSSAFSDCSSLTSITIPDSVNSIGDRAFYYCTGELVINSKIVEKNYSSDNYPQKGGGWMCGAKFTKLTIGNGVTSIGDRAFYKCTSLTSVTIPDSVTRIEDNAFDNCTSLTSVTIGNGVTSIEFGAFHSCTSLTSITIPDSVTSISEQVFENCTSLKSVTIGNSVTDISDYAFSGCTLLTSVNCKPTTPPTLVPGNFKGNASVRKIYVPIESVDAYKTASGWSDYADDIVGCVFEDEALVSGENIKTINGESILGSGNITISGSYVSMSNTWYDSPSSVTIAPNSSTEIADLGLTSIAINLTDPTDNSVVNTYTLIIRKFGFGNAFTFDKTIFWANDNAPVFDTTASDEFVEISIKRTFEGYYLGTWAKYSKYSV